MQQQYPQPPPPGHYPPPHGGYVQQPPPSGGGMHWLLILLIVGVVGVFVLGILAAIAIPAMTKYMRRSKTSEARVQLARIFDSVASYHGEHGRCPGEGAETSAGITPPLSVDCNVGEGGKCSAGGLGPAGYDETAWSANPIWSELGFAMDVSHYFHYDVRFLNRDDNGCQFEVRAYADLDDDGTYSTFERAGAADSNGVNSAAGMYIDQELE